jgi:dihydrofolate synthase / folylpolyglutamate synthase
VLRERAAALDAPLHRVASPGPPLRFLGLDGMECELPGFDRPVDIGLAGAHQAENAATAVAALRLLRVRGFGRIDDRRITEGLRGVRTFAGLRGRFEALQRAPVLVVDVGHNPDGIRVMLESWSAMRPMAHTHLVFGVLRSKDLAGIFRVIRPFAPRRVTLVQAESHEAFPLDGMLRIAADEGIAAEGRGDILEAVQEALATLEEGGERSASVLLFGSHYVVGAFLREWEKNRRDTPKSLDS